jgi:hypothetical protein
MQTIGLVVIGMALPHFRYNQIKNRARLKKECFGGQSSGIIPLHHKK